MFAKGKPKEGDRKVTPPSPSYMTSEQFATYLADLRSHRINRPGGARPQPASMARRDSARLSLGGRASPQPLSDAASTSHQRTRSDIPISGRPSLAGSVSSRYSMTSQGRDYIPDNPPVQPLKPSEVVPSSTYIERGQRWMEKEEAVSLRQAMEDMDVKDEAQDAQTDGNGNDDESRIYNAALDEAAELVWQHQNPSKLPQPGAPYQYRPHLRKNSYAHARTASAGLYGDDVVPTGLARDPSARSVSGSSSESDCLASMRSRTSFSSSRRPPAGYPDSRRESVETVRQPSPAAPEARGPPKSYGGLASSTQLVSKTDRRRSSLKRNISGEVERPFSGAHIWEEPESQAAAAGRAQREREAAALESVQPLRAKAKSPLNRVQFAPEEAGQAVGSPAEDIPPPPPPKVVSKYEIHRNAPSQSRNPQYTTNSSRSQSPDVPSIPRKQGVEIRGDDIRQATSMRLRDRSPKLPTPSAVSDRPGRPIVSFDKNWKPQKEATDEKPEESRQRGPSPLVPHGVRQEQQKKNVPAIAFPQDPAPASPSGQQAARPPVPPAIQVDGPEIPAIAVSDSAVSVPTIQTPDDSSTRSARPLPTPAPPGAPRSQALARPRGHWSPAPGTVAGKRATACCHECSRPIEGRFVSLAGGPERFHPQCFTCYLCGTSLEALEISPEPEAHRAARLERIGRRAAGEVLEERPGETMAEDGDERLRFYCHLDWHELFAPRCKHCTTPILGEHLVALGAHWHYGHFFCAECGDPFERGMTHIEKDGYAWCVGCQTRRTERRAPKCQGCRAAVVGQYVRALGGEWHDACFRCCVCAGAFDDGQIFPVEGRGVLCTACRQRELKA